MKTDIENTARLFSKSLDYKFNNPSSVDFYYDLVLGGKSGNDIVFELSNERMLTNRENSVMTFVNSNPNILISGTKEASHIALETKRFFLERCNPVRSMQSLIIMGKNPVMAFFESFFLPKAMAASIFGVFGTLSASELINFSALVASGSFYYSYLTGLVLLFTYYFAFVDLRYLKPKLTTGNALVRSIFPAISMLLYSMVLWLIVVGLIGYGGLSKIASLPKDFTLFELPSLTMISVSIAIALSSIWDKESITRPL